MVRLTKIYTRGGDKGETSLGDGSRIAKHDTRIAVLGTVDEANAVIGLARLHTSGEADAALSRIQNDLFDLGADLARIADLSRPESDAKGQGASDAEGPLRITQAQIDRVEAEIDGMNAELAPLESFVLPGGSEASATLHLARTVVRRGERLITELARSGPVNPSAIAYINRLSDHLFVLARHLNDKGGRDVLWRPGANR